MAVEPRAELWVFVRGVVIEDGVDLLVFGTQLTVLRKRMNSWWRCRCMFRPMTVP